MKDSTLTSKSLKMRYVFNNVSLNRLPSFCACGESFNATHALSCKKGGFVSKRHDNVWDLFTALLDKVCVNVQTEHHLIPLENERFDLRTANTSSEDRLDIKSKWLLESRSDSIIWYKNHALNKNCPSKTIFREHESSKKCEYLQRVLEVEHATFTPLVLRTNGGMGDKCGRFVSELANKLSLKQDEPYASIMSWIRTKLSFEILRSTIMCLRGLRIPWR